MKPVLGILLGDATGIANPKVMKQAVIIAARIAGWREII
jgi:hypothetical protein